MLLHPFIHLKPLLVWGIRRGGPPISPQLLPLFIPLLIQVTNFFLASSSPHSPDFHPPPIPLLLLLLYLKI